MHKLGDATDNQPLVSVIMPVYNQSKHLSDAIESVLTQSMPDLELIVVDDCSTDDTPDVIVDYCRLDQRVRSTRNEVNSRNGMIEWEPRNDGLKLARGSLIAYLDSDNMWHPDFLARLSTILLTQPAVQLVHCDSRNHHAEHEIATIAAADSRAVQDRGPGWIVFGHKDIVREELGDSQYIDTNEIMHRSAVFGQLGYLWRTVHPRREWVNKHQGKRCAYRRHNDLDLVERIIDFHGLECVVHIPETLVEFFYPSAHLGRAIIKQEILSEYGSIAQ